MTGDNVSSGSKTPYFNKKTQEWNLSNVAMFRGENSEGKGGGLGRGSLGAGLYVTPSQYMAKSYASSIQNGEVHQYKISPSAKIVSVDKLFQLGLDDYIVKNQGKSAESLIASFAKTHGIDGVSGSGSDAEFVIYNTKVIKRK